MKIRLDNDAKAPTRAYPTDAGLDIYSMDEKTIPPGVGMRFRTGVHVEIPKGFYGKLESKSGLNVNHGIVCPGGVIDCGYSGEIAVMLYNLSQWPYKVHKYDKICQLIVIPCDLSDVEIVEEIASGERGSSGFGSTGK